MKKALITASMASMLDNFNRDNIKILLEYGYQVTLAANFNGSEDSSPSQKLQKFKKEMEKSGCRVVQIDFTRKVGNILGQFHSYRQLKKLAIEDFDLVHCNSPICAALTRLVFRKKRNCGTQVIYTAHGFHFYKGAPVRNWLLYFPVEWVCAHWTDILNTMNHEDYQMAKRWLKVRKLVRLPGVGIDLKKFCAESVDRQVVRKSLGIGDEEKMLLSVGELSKRKNQGSVITALGLLEKERRYGSYFSHDILEIPPMRYVICGQGEMERKWRVLAERLGIKDRVQFLGYREDIPDLCRAADLFVFPSLQEGLPMALLEAMAMKTPVICSDIRGNRDLILDHNLRFHPCRARNIANCVKKAIYMDSSLVEINYKKAMSFRIEKTERIMRKEYKEI